MRWDGTDQKTILRAGGGGGRGGGGGGGGGGEMMMSPDGSRVLVQVERQGGPRVSRRGSPEDAATRRRSTRRTPRSRKCRCARSRASAASSATWAHDSQHIYYALGHSLVHVRPRRGRSGGARFDDASRGETRAGATAPRAGGGGAPAADAAAARRGGSPIYEATRHDVAITRAEGQAAGHGRAARRAHSHDEGRGRSSRRATSW